jgi:transposase
MYLRRCYRNKDGKRHGYWALVESYRSSRGPRQRVVAYLGEMDAAGRLGIHQQAAGAAAIAQRGLFQDLEPQWVEVDLKRIAIERKRAFGGPWLGLELCRQVGLVDFLEQTLPTGREEISWPVMAQILMLARLCEPSSELQIAEHFYEASALSDLLGVPANKVNEDRLYRSLDRLLPHKEELEKHLKDRLGELFDLDYDLLLYDVTSTYFEGEAKRNELAQRGYSRDHRPDCKQVNIALVVSREGMPLGYQLFTGNRNDGTTLEEIVERIERLYGRANRIWVLDRGMVSEENVRFLKEAKRRYIVGTPKSMLKRFEGELCAKDWNQVREGLEVRLCPAPGGEEVFLLCRSAQRKEKEQAMHERFEKRIEEGLEKIVASCAKRKQLPAAVGQRVGRLLGKNSRAAGAFEVKIDPDTDGFANCQWKRIDRWREWARLSEGCYVLRSNVTDWSPEELWRAYMQLTEAEAAFRIQKTDLQLRPIWHQKQERVEAHILVCFLAFVLWKTLAQLCQRVGLGNEPRKVFQELADITLVDVVLPTRNGVIIRKRCISRPTEHQAILLQHLNLHLPNSLELARV